MCVVQAYMYTTKFNPVQEHLLRMFEFAQSENTLKELKEVLFKIITNWNKNWMKCGLMARLTKTN